MKVCTDACLFGAVVAERLAQKAVATVLDIGAGTGLLSLMLAQKTGAMIDAVELDEAAFQQATENVQASIFNHRITVVNADIKNFTSLKKYDAIISNPPFFEGDLKSSQSNKNAAKHDTTLTLQQLLHAAKMHLSTGGLFAILLPFHRVNECIEMAASEGLYLSEKVLVKQTSAHSFFRGTLFFNAQLSASIYQEITIKDEAGNYTPAFTQLLKDYYLHL